jgi:hypothetical protein
MERRTAAIDVNREASVVNRGSAMRIGLPGCGKTLLAHRNFTGLRV